jgi:hypothetical protein
LKKEYSSLDDQTEAVDDIYMASIQERKASYACKEAYKSDIGSRSS